METEMRDVSDGAMGSVDEDKPKLNDQHETRNLIVYTTKLDDMKIFKDNTNRMSVDTIINSIIKESKPKLNRKRKCTQEMNSHNKYEDLFSRLNTFNKKAARIAKYNNRLLSMCKPVRVVLEDILHTSLLTQSIESRNYKSNKKVRRNIVSDKPYQSRKQCRIMYDLQLKEADIYYLNTNFVIEEYKKLGIEKSNNNILLSLKKDNKVWEFSCCCWYKREKHLKTLSLFPHETLRFMRKPHKCAINLCRCCCRDKTILVPSDTSSIMATLLKPSESHSIWLSKMTKMRTPLSEILRKNLLSKSVSVVSKTENMYPVNPGIHLGVHSTNINFGREHYAIGADGQIKLYLKRTEKDRSKLPNFVLKTADNIIGDICCWYKREEFAGCLLQLGALPNTVKYIRNAHPCPPTNCICCCKPLNTKKPELILLSKVARHTNDLVSKKVTIQVGFPGVVEPPGSAVPARANTNKISKEFSFYVSLSALEMISMGSQVVHNLIINPESGTLDKNTSVRVLLKSTGRTKVLIECSHLNSLTTKQLKMLDFIFCAVKKITRKQTITTNKRLKEKVKTLTGSIHTPYPLLLNAQLSVTADLRSKRFLPPLRAHLESYNLPIIKTIPEWRKEIGLKKRQ